VVSIATFFVGQLLFWSMKYPLSLAVFRLRVWPRGDRGG
jgi:hypothetical protein